MMNEIHFKRSSRQHFLFKYLTLEDDRKGTAALKTFKDTCK